MCRASGRLRDPSCGVVVKPLQVQVGWDAEEASRVDLNFLKELACEDSKVAAKATVETLVVAEDRKDPVTVVVAVAVTEHRNIF